MSTLFYQKEIPISGRYDVAVIGGGPAGIGAAIAAAEQGAKTVLIERFGFLGGMATAGYVNPMSEFAYNGRRITGGIPWRFAEALCIEGGAIVEEPRCNISFAPEKYKLVAHQLVESAGAHLLLNARLFDCITENNRVRAVIYAGMSGVQAVEADYFVDATGDATLAHLAGMPMLDTNKIVQPGTLCFCLADVDTSTERMHIIHQRNHRFNHQATFVREPLLKLRAEGVDVPQFGGPWLCTTLEEGCVTVNMTRSPMDSTDGENYQQAEFRMRKDVFRLVELMRAHVPEFANCRLVSTATVSGVRESRHIRGLHILTGEEYVKAVRFDDAIARACHPVDIHLPGDDGQKLTFPEDAGFIPYRSLIAAGFPNLLVAGRAISADADAFAAIRVQAPCMETGQAAGIAAALCSAAGGIAVNQLDVNTLVQAVRAAGSIV